VSLDQLAERIEQWKIDFERFLAGALQFPPDELKARIGRELRDLRSSPARGAAEQFRLSALEARFNAYGELNHRRLREREEGRAGRAVAPAAPRAAHDAANGIVITDRLEPEAVGALYDALAREQSGAPSMALDAFRGYLARQIESIRLKTGAEAVQFRLASEEGKIKLKARPVGSSG
jgi:hypothetical protein